MHNSKSKSIAVIPARIGSKRIKKKNIKLFNGKPIINWTIENLINSKLFSKIIISTDSHEIIKTVKKYNVEIPFLRPRELSDDKTKIIPVIRHFINNYDLREINYVCCVFPCAIFINKNDLFAGLKNIKKNTNKFSYAIKKYEHPIERSFKISKNNLIKFNNKNYINKNTNNLKKNYHDAGQFYWAHKEIWLSSNQMHNNQIGVILPSFKSIDIDDKDDWLSAEVFHKNFFR